MYWYDNMEFGPSPPELLSFISRIVTPYGDLETGGVNGTVYWFTIINGKHWYDLPDPPEYACIADRPDACDP